MTNVIEKNKSRLHYIDIAKGIGIISVVVGHIYYRGVISNIIYLFHMPLFFFVSGFLFKVNNNQRSFLSTKFKQLIIPYLIYLILIYFIQEVIYFTSNPITIKAIIKGVIAAVYGGRELAGFTSVFWFVPCLFFVLVLMNFLFSKCKFNWLIAFVVLSTLISYLNAAYFPLLKLPYDINAVFAIVPIFFLGYLSKSFRSKGILIGAIFLSITGVLLICGNYQNYYDIKNAFYGIPVITLITSVSLVYTILFLSEKMEKVSGPFFHIGQASLVIMYLHQPIQLLTKMYLTDNVYARIVISITISYLFYLIAKRYTWTRAMFIGSKEDLKKIEYRFKKINAEVT